MIKFLCIYKIKIKKMAGLENYEWYLSRQWKEILRGELASLQQAEIVNWWKMHHDISERMELIRDKLYWTLNN